MSTWIVPLLGVDFQDDFDKMLIDYIEANYNIADPVKTDTDHFRFSFGFFDLNQPYEITTLEPQNATRREQELGPRENNMSTLMEVHIRAERLNPNGRDPQLGAMEREVIRIIGQYRPNNIVGIRNMTWEGGGRDYSNIRFSGNDWDEQDWRAIVYCRIFYEKRDTST